MKIEISGRSKVLCKAEVKFAAAFFAQYLMGTRLAKNLFLDISFDNLTGIADGYCHPYEAGSKPRMFEIAVDTKLTRRKQLTILAHEMVHVKQYAKSELRSDTPTSAKFAGKTYRITSSLEDYLNYPWEIEAFGRERGLYLLYTALLKESKIKFKNGKMYMNGKLFKLPKTEK